MARYYPENYICYLEAIEDDPDPINRMNRMGALKKRVRQVVQRMNEPGRILDIGCATGIFLNRMKELGWETKGVEPSAEAAEYAITRFNLDVTHGYLADANLPDDFFDVVTIWDVIEHVPEIKPFIREIYRILKPGGLVIATLPNGKAWERYIFGEYWVGWEIPRHYRTFTPETIKSFLQRYGFKDAEIFSFIGRHGAFMLSVAFWLNTWKGPDWLKKIIQVILGSLPFRILTHPFFLFAEAVNRSNVMSFTAEKPRNHT
jgi:SAM-dependent methyltransferase